MKKKFSLSIAVVMVVFSLVIMGSHQDVQAAFPGGNGKIAFTSTRNGNYQIYTMDNDGTNQTRLTNNSASDFAAGWSPTGKKIIFTSNRDSSNYEIYTMNFDGTNQTRITNNSTSELDPRWSPDGSKIVFSSNRDSSNYQIYTMDSDGTNQTRITNNSTNDFDHKWSPDGTKLSFTSDRDGNYEIYTMNTDGTNQTRLTNNAATDRYPEWSPDGTKLSFTSSRGTGGGHEIFIMNSDGSNQTQITDTIPDNTSPTWSPDGTKISFESNRGVGYDHIYTMNIDGTNQTQLTSTASDNDWPIWQPSIGASVISPDGRIITKITSSQDYSLVNYPIANNETLTLDGSVCDVTVPSGAVLKGIGQYCTILVDPGGILSPGSSPGCLTGGSINLSGNYEVEISSETACSGYDQIQVTGTVTVSGSLSVKLLNDFIPTYGSVFTIVSNDGSDPVVGIFDNLPEGASIIIGSTEFRISYIGGDGNDITLTTLSLPGLPKAGNVASSSFTHLAILVGALSTVLITAGLRMLALKLR